MGKRSRPSKSTLEKRRNRKAYLKRILPEFPYRQSPYRSSFYVSQAHRGYNGALSAEPKLSLKKAVWAVVVLAVAGTLVVAYLWFFWNLIR